MAIGSSAKYLLITSNFPPVIGGSAAVYGNLCRAASGEIAVLTARRDYRSGRLLNVPAAFEGHETYPVERIELLRPLEPFTHRRPLPRALGICHDAALAVRVFSAVARLVRSHGIEAIIIGDLVYGGWIGIAARRLLGVPFVVYLHGEELTIKAKGLAARAVPHCLRSAAGLVAVSDFTCQVLVERYGVGLDRIALIRNGVDTAQFRPQARSPDLARRYALEGMQVLLTVGRLVPRKGIDRVLRALPSLATRIPNLHYLIVGDGPFREELERQAANLGVRHLVTFCGEIPEGELVQHYSLADLFVMPNRQTPEGDTEGFGLVFLEAGACGIPVIAGNAGGTADAVADGVNGLIVDGDDVPAIEEAVLRVLSDRSLAERLGRNGLTAAAQASWDSRWRSLADFLAQSTGRRIAANPLRARSTERLLEPTVSVVLPAYNAERTIARALDSVLSQTYRPSEIIVVDDGSKDTTAGIVRTYSRRGVELLRNSTPQGAAAARNAGIRHSRGAFVAFQDADDEWLPHKLQQQIPLIASAPTMALVSCWAEQVIAGRPVGLVNQGRRPAIGVQTWKSLLACPSIATPCAVVRRETLFEVGLFDPQLPVAEDQDLWIKLARAGEVGFVDEVLARVHDTEGSLTKRYGVAAIDHVLAMVCGHLASAAAELSPNERRAILRRRFASLGRTACELGAPRRGAALLLKAAVLGHISLRDALIMAKSMLPVTALKRFFEGRIDRFPVR